MKLIDLKGSWKLWSVQIAALGFAVNAAWLSLPSQLQDKLAEYQWINFSLFGLAVLARFVSQEKPNGPDSE